MKEEYRLSHSIGTKVTEAEYKQLLKRAGKRKMAVWIREKLLSEVAPRSLDVALMSELLATKTIVINLLNHLAAGKKVHPETMPEFVKNSRDGLLEKARKALAATED